MKKVITIAGCIVALAAGFAYGDVIGYPWSTWGGISYAPNGNVDKGVILNSYVEQGIDWMEFNQSAWILNTFAGVDISVSDHSEEYWNNKTRPTVGQKVKHSFDSGADINLGMRGEYSDYFRNSAGNDWRGIAFIQWSAGGNLKK